MMIFLSNCIAERQITVTSQLCKKLFIPDTDQYLEGLICIILKSQVDNVIVYVSCRTHRHSFAVVCGKCIGMIVYFRHFERAVERKNMEHVSKVAQTAADAAKTAAPT